MLLLSIDPFIIIIDLFKDIGFYSMEWMDICEDSVMLHVKPSLDFVSLHFFSYATRLAQEHERKINQDQIAQDPLCPCVCVCVSC